MVTTRLFEEPIEAIEPPPAQAPLASRIFCCAGASLVAIVPAVAATYSAFQVTRFFRTFTDAEAVRGAKIAAQLSVFNTPLIFALGVSALLAFGIAITLATDSKRRQASVGLLFSIAVPILGITPALLLWWAESTTFDVLSGKHIGTSPEVTAQTISTLLFLATASGLIVPCVVFGAAVVSVFLSGRSRMNTLSMSRAFVWGAVGMVLLILAGAFFALI
jgi:hypothetical protein